MNRGLAYDSDAGRAYAAGVTALMPAEAALQSSPHRRATRAARSRGTRVNREPYLKVMGMHRDAAYRLDRQSLPTDLLDSHADRLGRGGGARREGRIPQRAALRARAHRHDRLPDGLRHDRRRARYRADQVQAPGRRRLPEDRQQHRAGRAQAPGLLGAADRGDRRATSTSTRRSRARRTSRTSTSPSSTAPSSPPTGHAASTTTGTSR